MTFYDAENDNCLLVLTNKSTLKSYENIASGPTKLISQMWIPQVFNWYPGAFSIKHYNMALFC